MSEERTQQSQRCTAPDEFSPGRCVEYTDHESGLCGGHRAQAGERLPEAVILSEIRWVAIEARALMSAGTDPERIVRFEDRKRALLSSIREW